jgi:hypothetical protein
MLTELVTVHFIFLVLNNSEIPRKITVTIANIQANYQNQELPDKKQKEMRNIKENSRISLLRIEHQTW